MAKLDKYLRKMYETYARTSIKNEWLKILSNLEIKEEIWGGKKVISADYSNFELIFPDGEGNGYRVAMKETYWGQKEAATKLGDNLHPGSDYFVLMGRFSINNEINFSQYPFTDEILEKLISIQRLQIGNAEIGEITRIQNLNPLRYFINLEQLIICNNTIQSLEPILNLPNLKRVWIENTDIPILERESFRSSNPDCELEDIVYL